MFIYIFFLLYGNLTKTGSYIIYVFFLYVFSFSFCRNSLKNELLIIFVSSDSTSRLFANISDFLT